MIGQLAIHGLAGQSSDLASATVAGGQEIQGFDSNQGAVDVKDDRTRFRHKKTPPLGRSDGVSLNNLDYASPKSSAIETEELAEVVGITWGCMGLYYHRNGVAVADFGVELDADFIAFFSLINRLMIEL